MSKPFDLLIRNGQVVFNGGVSYANLAVRGGRIAAILSPDERPAAEEYLDAKGLHILPGIIDTHVHFREPGHGEREDFLSGTQAAAASGVTTVLDMPTSDPPVNSADVFRRRAERLSGRAVVDFGLYAAVGFENPEAIQGLAEAGAVAFKTFLHAPTPERAAEFHGLWCTDEGVLRELMVATAQTGLLHCFHAEHNALIDRLQAELIAQGRVDSMAHALSRPPLTEEVSVAMLLALAADTGGPVQVVHTSSPSAARLIRDAKARGVRVTAETCPHYLFLDETALRDHGPFARVSPPLRSTVEMHGLWRYLEDGTFDVIGSDHSPFLQTEKERGLHNIFSAPAGMPGIEMLLPLMLTAAAEGRISLPRLAVLMSTNAARIFRLPGKGQIDIGYDADLTLVDMEVEWAFDPERCYTKARNSLKVYAGRPVKGSVKRTLVRGTTVFDGETVVVQPGFGRFLRPTPALRNDR